MNIYGQSGESEGKVLKSVQNSDRLSVKNGWISCPFCKRNHRLMRVLPETQARNLEVFCRDCKSTIILDIDQGQRVELRSQ